MSTKPTSLPLFLLPTTAEYSLTNLPKPYKETTFNYIEHERKISVQHKGNERFWAEVLADGQVAPGGNHQQICTVHAYVTSIIKIINLRPSPRGQNVVNQFFRQTEGPVVIISNWTFTATDLYCIGCMITTLACVAVTIGYLMTLPCPLL